MEPLEPAVTGLDGPLTPNRVDEQLLERHSVQLARLRGLMSPYEAGDLRIHASDRQLLAQADALRQLLEQIYGQHITFQGESRPGTGTPLRHRGEGLQEQVTQVIASGEGAIAIGGNAHGTFITGSVGQRGDDP